MKDAYNRMESGTLEKEVKGGILIAPAYRYGSLEKIWNRIKQIPKNLLHYTAGKVSGIAQSAEMKHSSQKLEVSKSIIDYMETKLADQLKNAVISLNYEAKLSEDERKLISDIRSRTDNANRNNVTRTEAYRTIYFRHPELHWALLAHMVSRNGGWSMTDLQGELLPRLLNRDQRQHLFLFLERANALIFQDAYPQLLLYEECLHRQRSMFHLLPAFHVSAFMKPFWHHFWLNRDSVLLTIALIINEQNYIERRVVRNPGFQKHVFQTPAFQAQALLQLNQVVFPYVPKKKGDPGIVHITKDICPASDIRLAGLILEDFTDLDERIEAGKKLYAILFGVTNIMDGVLPFAASTKHTASRADYWPHMFDKIKKAPPTKPFAERLDGCRLLKGADPFYSPELAHAWKDRPVEPSDRFDWFIDLAMIRRLGSASPPTAFEMTNEYCFGINKIELAVLAGQQLF